jgi:hypothetical protein
MYILVSGFGDKVKENPDVAALFAWLPDNVRRVHPIFIYLSYFILFFLLLSLHRDTDVPYSTYTFVLVRSPRSSSQLRHW